MAGMRRILAWAGHKQAKIGSVRFRNKSPIRASAQFCSIIFQAQAF